MATSHRICRHQCHPLPATILSVRYLPALPFLKLPLRLRSCLYGNESQLAGLNEVEVVDPKSQQSAHIAEPSLSLSCLPISRWSCAIDDEKASEPSADRLLFQSSVIWTATQKMDVRRISSGVLPLYPAFFPQLSIPLPVHNRRYARSLSQTQPSKLSRYTSSTARTRAGLKFLIRSR